MRGDGTENAATKDDDDDRNVVTVRKEARRIIKRILDRGVVILLNLKKAYRLIPGRAQ
jgi:hypothetical protein